MPTPCCEGDDDDDEELKHPQKNVQTQSKRRYKKWSISKKIVSPFVASFHTYPIRYHPCLMFLSVCLIIETEDENDDNGNE